MDLVEEFVFFFYISTKFLVLNHSLCIEEFNTGPRLARGLNFSKLSKTVLNTIQNKAFSKFQLKLKSYHCSTKPIKNYKIHKEIIIMTNVKKVDFLFYVFKTTGSAKSPFINSDLT